MNSFQTLSKKIVIAICGSYGKTTVKEILFTLFSQKYKVLATTRNENTPLGISKLVQKLSTETEILLLEFGEFVRGDIRDLCRLFPPDIGIITGINQQHNERMGGIENAISCMFEMAEFAKTLLLNIDDENIVQNWSKFVENVPEIASLPKNSQKNIQNSSLAKIPNSNKKAFQKILFYSAQNHNLASLKFQKASFDKQKLSWQVEIDKKDLETLKNNFEKEAENLENSDLNSVLNSNQTNSQYNSQDFGKVENLGTENIGIGLEKVQNSKNLNTANQDIVENSVRKALEDDLEDDYADFEDLRDFDKKNGADNSTNSTKETQNLVQFEINLLGNYAVGGLMLGAILGKILNLNNLQIQKGLQSVKPVKHRLEPIWNEKSGVLVIDDSYNGNPDGVMAAIEVLAKFRE